MRKTVEQIGQQGKGSSLLSIVANVDEEMGTEHCCLTNVMVMMVAEENTRGHNT